MLKTILLLPDGRELSSGIGMENAIRSIRITESVNDTQELSPGSVCAAAAEITIFTPGSDFSLAAGDTFTLFRQDSTGTRHKIGVFIGEQPTHPTANTMKLVAYDRVSCLDRDLTQWLAGLTQWPYSLEDLANRICQACGVELVTQDIPNGAYPVQKFSAEGVTGRQLMKWVGQIAGRFCRATDAGKLELAWYTPLDGVICNNGHLNITAGELTVAEGKLVSDTIPITDDGKGNLSLTLDTQVEGLYYYRDGLSFADYTVAPIEKVQLRQKEGDVGTVYPPAQTTGSTYIITGNPMLSAMTGEDLQAVAQTLYTQLQGITYRPCSLSVPPTPAIRPGHILSLTDPNGRVVTAYLMTKTQSGQRDTLESTGSQSRESATAVNNRSFRALTGKVLNLRTDVDGIRAENAAADGRTAKLELQVAGISTTVLSQQEAVDGLRQSVTDVRQTADSLTVQVQNIRDNGVSRVSSSLGLTIDGTAVTISRSGSGMTNSLDETGMYVIRSKDTANEAVMLKANADGVIATDVSVRNYLIIGNHARLEDYNDGADGRRTACFFLGGA